MSRQITHDEEDDHADDWLLGPEYDQWRAEAATELGEEWFDLQLEGEIEIAAEEIESWLAEYDQEVES